MDSPKDAAADLLANLDRLRALDRSGMLDILNVFPDRIAHADALGSQFDPGISGTIGSVVITGKGVTARSAREQPMNETQTKMINKELKQRIEAEHSKETREVDERSDKSALGPSFNR